MAITARRHDLSRDSLDAAVPPAEGLQRRGTDCPHPSSDALDLVPAFDAGYRLVDEVTVWASSPAPDCPANTAVAEPRGRQASSGLR